MSASHRSFAAVIALVHLATQVVASPPTPHIVFVMVDDLGFNDVGYHSDGSLIETDNIDALAGGGVKLESYYVAPLCTPSRSQFLSGQYLIHNGMQHLVIEPREPRCLPLNDTLANKLTDAGYASHLVGKWHLGYYKKECWPLNRGFQSFFGLLLGSGDHFSHTYTDAAPSRGNCAVAFVGRDLRDNETDVQSQYDGRHSTYIFTERAQEIIQNHNKDEPMFMYLAYQAPHLPFEVPDEYSNYYKGKISGNKNRRVYAGMVTMLDEAIGNLTDTLKEEEMWNDTVLVFSTDNGGVGKRNAGNNWPLRGVKGNYFEGGIRGVGFVASPLLSPSVQGTENTDLMHISDWFPTLVEGVANMTLDYDTLELDGVNMWDSISQGTAGDPDREMVFNIDPNMTLASVDPKYDDESLIFDVSIQAAIRKGDMKLITGKQVDGDWVAPYESSYSTVNSPDAADKAVWLYNITADPWEQTDLSDSMPDEVDYLLGRLQFYRSSSSFVEPSIERNDCDADPADARNCGLWTNWGDPTPSC